MRVADVLARLGPHHRVALALRYVDGLPVPEVADLLVGVGVLGTCRGHRWNPDRGRPVLAVPSRSPVPPKPEEGVTGADGAFVLRGLRTDYYRLLVVGPDGTTTLAGMVDGDPETATEFFLDFPDVGDITLGAP